MQKHAARFPASYWTVFFSLLLVPVFTALATLSDEQVLARLHVQNQIQIRGGNLIGTRGGIESVRKLARKVARDHVAADAQLQKIAQEQKLNINTVHPTSPREKELLQRQRQNLERLSATERDRFKQEGAPASRIFLKNTIDNYGSLIPMMKTTIAKTGNEQVKIFLAWLLPEFITNQQSAEYLFKSIEKQLRLPAGELQKAPDQQPGK